MEAGRWDAEHLWRYRARLLRVIDGDTCVVLADTGFNGRQEVHVRLRGLSAPEMREPGGVKAAQALALALARIAAAGAPWPLRVVSAQKERAVGEVTTFERYVCDILDADGRSVLELMGGVS